MQPEFKPTRPINIVGRFEIKLVHEYRHLAQRVFADLEHPFADKATMNWDEDKRRFLALAPQTDFRSCVMFAAARVKIYAPWRDLTDEQKYNLASEYGSDVAERYDEFEVTSPTTAKPSY